jgi:hypothetical protein
MGKGPVDGFGIWVCGLRTSCTKSAFPWSKCVTPLDEIVKKWSSSTSACGTTYARKGMASDVRESWA